MKQAAFATFAKYKRPYN